MQPAPPLALTFHAERLHDPEVWRRTESIARQLADHGRLATFFVYPFRAAVEGASVIEPVAALGALGHEIAQHTHFYAGIAVSGAGKRNDLSPENVGACLVRDRAVLREAGFEPRGFVAGAWLADVHVLDALADLGFDYDMSSHVRATSNEPATSGVAWLDRVQRHSNGLLRIPTTASLGQWWRKGHLVRRPAIECEVVYLHDYDLLRRGAMTLVRQLANRTPARRWVTGGDLARRFSAMN